MSPEAATVQAIIVGQGKTLDFIDGRTQRNDTPEEYVRQEIAKSLVREYRYSKSDIAVEYTLAVGTRRPRADLVIFPVQGSHEQSNARIIVECKAPSVKSADKKEGVSQLQSYMHVCPNCDYGMWTNGIERFCYRRLLRSDKVVIEEVPDLPECGRTDEDADRPRFDQLKAATSDALLFAFRRCHNYIAGNQGLQKPQAFWELLKLIFCKIHDERTDEIQFFAAANERHGINGPLKVQKRLEELFAQVKSDYPTIFKRAESIDLKPIVLAYIVSQLQMYSLLESDIDVKGRAYEEIVGSNLRGDRGEFFTPRNICRMAVAMLDPGEKEIVLDPACGTGGFLITAMNHVIEKIRLAETAKHGDKKERIEREVEARKDKFAERFIIGIDFNPELVKASKMNMVMNNDGSGGLYQGNSLAAPATWEESLRERAILGKVDCLFTNPPFGAHIPVTDTAILEQFDLGHMWSYNRDADHWTKSKSPQKAQPPEILFIERCVQFLRPGGRMAIVLPDGILGSPGLGYVRQWILVNARVLASIDLHPDTFQPSVSVQTSLLILERKSAEQIAVETAAGRMSDYSVFMASANHVGHDKRGTRTFVRDEHGNEIVEEIEEQIREWQDGVLTYRKQTTRRKVVDDNTIQIAQTFRRWLSERD